MKVKFAIVTTSRADLGILKPLIKKLLKKKNNIVISTASNLSKKLGFSQKELSFVNKNQLFKINTLENVKISPKSIFELTLNKFNIFFKKKKIEYIIILGDRYETLGVALSAYFNKIKIIHLYGGEKTFGSDDNIFRNCITQLSDYHFCSTKNSLINLNNILTDKKKIIHIGSLSVEKIKNKFKKKEKKNYCIISIHPEKKIHELINFTKQIFKIILKKTNFKIILTGTNIDFNSDALRKVFFEQLKLHKNRIEYYENLGTEKYLNFLSHAKFLIGNSSSGIIESPSLKTPFINIGERQAGRETAKSTIFVGFNIKKTINAINNLQSIKNSHFKNPYYKKNTLKNMELLLSKI
jgi:UDP-hydrolysing UDP-N-acetyl-D-glucosamine 2-epimerase